MNSLILKKDFRLSPGESCHIGSVSVSVSGVAAESGAGTVPASGDASVKILVNFVEPNSED